MGQLKNEVKFMFFQGLIMKGFLLIAILLLLEIHCFKAHKSNTTATASLNVTKFSEISGTETNRTQVEDLPKALLLRTRRSSAEIEQLPKSPVRTTTRATKAPRTTRSKASRSRSSTTEIPGTDWFYYDDPSGEGEGYWFKFEDDGETMRMMPGKKKNKPKSAGAEMHELPPSTIAAIVGGVLAFLFVTGCCLAICKEEKSEDTEAVVHLESQPELNTPYMQPNSNRFEYPQNRAIHPPPENMSRFLRTEE